MRVGIGVGLGVGMGCGMNVGSAEIDALSGKYRPATQAQWAALGVTPATDTWRCQEASGNLVSDAGAALVPNNAPLYQQDVDGWLSKAVALTAVANQEFSAATYNDIATSSLMALMYMVVDATPASTRGLLAVGSSISAVGIGVTSTPNLRYRNGGTIVDSTGAYTAAVAPVVFQHDITNSIARVYTEDEKLSPAFAGVIGSILALGTSTSAACRILYFAAWRGVAAEQSGAQIKAMLQSLRWNPSWTP